MYITANVPTMEKGTAAPGISVAEMLRRNRKMTNTTTQMVSSRVNSTSRMEARIGSERSVTTVRFSAGGISRWNWGSSARMSLTTSTVLVPGCFWMARITARLLLYHAASFVFYTLVI